jgi:hypothetical protein
MPGLDVPAWEAVFRWHLGSYVPYCKRATLHDVVDTPEFIEWRKKAARSTEHGARSG